MKSKFLFPTWCKLIGYIMVVPGFVLGYFNAFHDYEIPHFGFQMREKDSFFQTAFENFTNELAIFLVVIGLFLIAFSKSKKEDELSAKVRLSSLYWGVMIYYILLFFNVIWGNIMSEVLFDSDHALDFTIFMMMIIFIARFSYLSLISKERYIMRKPKFLPHRPFKILGIFISLLGLVFLIYTMFMMVGWDNNLDDYAYATSIFGLFIWAFSKHKTEDEMTMQLRLESLQLAVYFNYAILLLATLLVYSLAYLYVLAFSTLSLLLFFIIRMEYINYKNNQLLKNLEGDLSHEK
jgi:hypothetical protein